MSTPRFKVGDLVRINTVAGIGAAGAFMDALARNSVSGIHEIKAIIADGPGQPCYHLTRGDSSSGRPVPEARLTPARYRS